MSDLQTGFDRGCCDSITSEYSCHTTHCCPATEASTWFPYQSFCTLFFTLYMFFIYCMRCPPLGKFAFPKEGYCSLFSFYAFTQCPLSAQLTQGSNLVLIWEFMGRVCFKYFFLPWGPVSAVVGRILCFWVFIAFLISIQMCSLLWQRSFRGNLETNTPMGL